jgi:nicotinate-nucleotide pyrophosphorylase (carboxylating)
MTPSVLEPVVRRALEEDLQSGDLTSEACIPASHRSRARAVAREALVVAGVAVVREVARQVDPSVGVASHAEEGARVEAGTVLWELAGPTRAILAIERTALNLAQRMGGIATTTRRYVDALAPGSKTRITDTRKTMPGLRALDRWAVRCGGGFNHRDNLGSGVLIKDNHVVACGGVGAAVRACKAYAPHTVKIECEVDRLDQIEEAIAAGADALLLDNMGDATVAEALAIVAGRAFVEVSGGITLERVRALSALGVDAISVGALTHSVRAIDIGLDFVEDRER